MNKSLFSAAYLLALICLGQTTPGAAGEFNKTQLDAKFRSLGGTDTGAIFIRLQDGKVLYENASDKLLCPASVTKVITSAASLSYFGPAFSFVTPISFTGKFERGILSGDLFIKGNGDPFIVSEIVWQMAVDLRHIGLKEITGNIIIDNSLFDHEDRDESRLQSTGKSTHAYDAPISALAVNFNTVGVATASVKRGQNAISSVTPFPLLHTTLKGQVSTSPGDQADGVKLARATTADGGVVLTSSGMIGEDAPIKKIFRSVGDSNVAAGDYMLGFLKEAGIKVRGKSKTGVTPKDAQSLYDINGYEMRRIVQGLNTFSNNFIADMLTKRLGAAFGSKERPDEPGSGRLVSGVQVLNQFLRSDIGIKDDLILVNGSGLSIENRLSARQVAKVLAWMEHQGDLFPDFVASLPANGWDGTLKKRLKKADALAGQIHAKSGTLSEPITVAALAGYFRHSVEGWVAFVMIANGRPNHAQPGILETRNVQDDILKDLLLPR